MIKKYYAMDLRSVKVYTFDKLDQKRIASRLPGFCLLHAASAYKGKRQGVPFEHIPSDQFEEFLRRHTDD